MMVAALISGKNTIVVDRADAPEDLMLILEDQSGCEVCLIVRDPVAWVEQLIEIVNFSFDEQTCALEV